MKPSENPNVVAIVGELTAQRDHFSARCLTMATAIAGRDEMIAGLRAQIDEIRAAEEPLLARINDLTFENEQLRASLAAAPTAAPDVNAGAADAAEAELAAADQPVEDHPLEPEPRGRGTRKIDARKPGAWPPGRA